MNSPKEGFKGDRGERRPLDKGGHLYFVAVETLTWAPKQSARQSWEASCAPVKASVLGSGLNSASRAGSLETPRGDQYLLQDIWGPRKTIKEYE